MLGASDSQYLCLALLFRRRGQFAPPVGQRQTSKGTKGQRSGAIDAHGLLHCRTQDFITPADQQFDGDAQPGDKARHMRSPAVLSPNRVKRPRNAAGAPLGMARNQLASSESHRVTVLSQCMLAREPEAAAVTSAQLCSLWLPCITSLLP